MSNAQKVCAVATFKRTLPPRLKLSGTFVTWSKYWSYSWLPVVALARHSGHGFFYQLLQIDSKLPFKHFKISSTHFLHKGPRKGFMHLGHNSWTGVKNSLIMSIFGHQATGKVYLVNAGHWLVIEPPDCCLLPRMVSFISSSDDLANHLLPEYGCEYKGLSAHMPVQPYQVSRSPG